MPVLSRRYRKPFLVYLIISVNLFVFFLWMYPPLTYFMLENFLVSWLHLSDGRWWVLLTSAFSHNMMLHLFVNMLVLMSFGSMLEYVLGRITFFTFYLIAAVVSSLSHALVSKFVLGLPDQMALGASGAIAGLVLLFSLMFPREKILVFGIIPVPAIFGALAFVALDLWGLSAQSKGGGLPIGHGAHLGGSFAGILAYFFYIRRRLRS